MSDTRIDVRQSISLPELTSLQLTVDGALILRDWVGESNDLLVEIPLDPAAVLAALRSLIEAP